MRTIATCVTCEQVLTGGRCTNGRCPAYSPLEEDEHEECQQRIAALEAEVKRVKQYSLCMEGLTVAGFMAGVQCPDCGMGAEHAAALAAPKSDT